jgi:hypothetical protein
MQRTSVKAWDPKVLEAAAKRMGLKLTYEGPPGRTMEGGNYVGWVVQFTGWYQPVVFKETPGPLLVGGRVVPGETVAEIQRSDFVGSRGNKADLDTFLGHYNNILDQHLLGQVEEAFRRAGASYASETLPDGTIAATIEISPEQLAQLEV